MPKATYSETVRPWLERFMESNGAKVWALVINQAEDEKTAGKLWLHIFVTAMSRIRPERIANYDDSWFMNLVSSILAEFANRGVQMLHGSLQWPDMDEEGDTPQNACEQGESEQGIPVPPMLIVRTIQVLHATSAYLDAKRQHKGPGWTFAAALVTVIFAFFAIGYGALAHFGYPASKLWSFIFGYDG
jgi:hypothetical protein